MNLEKLNRIKSVLRKLVEVGKNATPGPWREGTENVWQDHLMIPVLHTSDRAFMENGSRRLLREKDQIDWLQFDCAFIAQARNIGPSACEALLTAISALENEAQSRWSKKHPALEAIIANWPEVQP